MDSHYETHIRRVKSCDAKVVTLKGNLAKRNFGRLPKGISEATLP